MTTDSTHHSSTASPDPTTEAQTSLTEPQRELIAFFVNAAQAFGLPKSVGEIYGLFFASSAPLALDDVVHRLQISKGSASQGIRFLKDINALVSHYRPGDRRDHYLPETSLRRIADGFISQRIRPQLRDGAIRLKQLSNSTSEPSDMTLQERVETISAWTKKANLLFPVVSKFLGTVPSKKFDPTI